MEDLRHYTLSVVVAAIICAISLELVKKYDTKKYVQLICGLFIAFTVVRPLLSADLSELLVVPGAFSQDAQTIVYEGVERNRKAVVDIIKAESEAYILDKAEQLNAEISVDVKISTEAPYIPVSAEITGSVSPYTQQKIESFLQTQMGITKENQKWTYQE